MQTDNNGLVEGSLAVFSVELVEVDVQVVDGLVGEGHEARVLLPLPGERDAGSVGRDPAGSGR